MKTGWSWAAASEVRAVFKPKRLPPEAEQMVKEIICSIMCARECPFSEVVYVPSEGIFAAFDDQQSAYWVELDDIKKHARSKEVLNALTKVYLAL